MTSDPLLARIEATIARHTLLKPGDTVVVGVSGGADSLVLLHALHSLDRWRLHVATLDHGLRGADGAADAGFVRQIAATWALPVTVGRADVPGISAAYRLNTEEAARQIRYAFLQRVARQIGAAAVAVGHHQDDQAETVLMHLIRGSGLDGLCGMRPAISMQALALPDQAEISFSPPFKTPPALPESWPMLIRPLLDVPRAAIDAYAAANDLQPRHDATNDDPRYLRNRLRHEVIPLLAELNPTIGAALARTADILRDDAALMHRAGESALQQTVVEARSAGVVLDRDRWRGLSPAEKRMVLRALIARLRPDRRDVEFEHVENAIRIADTGTTGAAADLPGGLTLRVSYGTLIIGPADLSPDLFAPALPPDDTLREFCPGDRVQWTFGAWTFEAEPLELGDHWENFHAEPLAARLQLPADSRLMLRTRRPGERFQPNGLGGHSQKLSDTLINLRVAQAWRDRVPLLVVDDRIAWFVAPTANGGLRGRVAEPFVPRAGEPETGMMYIKVCWNYRDP